MRAPEREVRLAGRAISVRLRGRSGRMKLELLARLLGLLSVPSRLGRGPKDSLLMPDVDSLATCFVVDWGVSSAAIEELLTVLPPVRFLLLMVTLAGMKSRLIVAPLRGEARGGVLTGAGNFDLADWTRCSSLCICAVRVRICVSEVELGRPLLLFVVAGAFDLVLLITEGVAFLVRDELSGTLTPEPLEVRTLPEVYRAAGFGVVLESPEGSLSLLFGGLRGVLTISRAEPDASEIGGDGGVGVSDTVSVVETDFVSGGVVIMGEEAVEDGESTKDGEFGAVISVVMLGTCRFLSLSCIISASILRSDSSSRSR